MNIVRFILDRIDDLLNKITMYRVVLYVLIGLLVIAGVLSYFGKLPFTWIDLAVSVGVILGVSLLVNKIFVDAFSAPANVESVYITALILALIITPVKPGQLLSLAGLPFFIWAAVWAMASKFMLAIRKKHIFNPAAFAVALTSLTINQSATWWIGTAVMAPFALIGAFLVIRKTVRTDLAMSFFAAAFASVLVAAVARGLNPAVTLQKVVLQSPILFFAGIMLTEPLTMPPTKELRVVYGVLVGVLFSPYTHIGTFYPTPEIALLLGNLFAYLVSPKEKYVLTLLEKIPLTLDTYEFSFTPNQKMKFNPGQYLEWTLGHARPDARGNRRYFTIASSPEEDRVKLGVKFYEKSSSFKRRMLSLNPGDAIMAGSRAGDFVLPRDKDKKLVFLAGGIGITPFRSMIKHLSDAGEKRTITLVFSNKTKADIVYQDVFDEAAKKLGIKIVHTLTDAPNIPADWDGYRGPIDSYVITKEIPDYRSRMFYVSGPHGFVSGMETMLLRMGIPNNQIKTDFFPGFA